MPTIYTGDMLRQGIISAVLSVALLAAADSVATAKKLIADKKFEEAVTELKAAQKANPKSAAVQKLLAEASMGAADALMSDNSLPPMRKYPAALRHYREVVKLDPKNKKAAENIAMIEGIYRQMGRPIPQ